MYNEFDDHLAAYKIYCQSDSGESVKVIWSSQMERCKNTGVKSIPLAVHNPILYDMIIIMVVSGSSLDLHLLYHVCLSIYWLLCVCILRKPCK